MKRKYIFIVLFLFSITIVYSNAYLITKNSTPSEYDTIKKLGEFYINSKILDQNNINKSVSNNISFYFYNQKILELNEKSQYSKIDFNNKYDNSLIESNENIYVREDIIKEFLSLNSYNDVEKIYFYKDMPVIKNISFTNNIFKIEVDRTLTKSMFNINKINNSIILSIKPVLDIKYIPSELNYTYDRGQIYLKFDDIPYYRDMIDGSTFTLNFNYSVDNKNNNQSKSLLDLNYKEDKYVINDNELKVYSVTFDPKKYDLEVGLNNLGKASSVEKYFKDNPDIISSINSSYFDVNTLEPVGNIIINGQLEHLSAYSRPALYITEKGDIDIDYVKLEYKININGLLFWVKAVNSEWKAEVKVYTKNYLGNIEEDFSEYNFFVIEDGKVVNINTKDFNNNQKLLLIDKKYEKYLKDIKKGDSADFSISYSENVKSKIITLVEGGPILLNNDYSEEMLLEEKRAYSNGIIYGKSPRTAFAIDENNMVTFIVAEGYIDENKGLNYDGMKQLIEKMGNYRKAIMFDGGGSSLFYFDNKIINNGSERLRNYIPVFINIYPEKK